jgi:hypothetical protein
MEHINRVGKPGRINDAVGARVIPHPNFLNALANTRHWFEVIGLLATLHFVELIAAILLHIGWKPLMRFSESPRKLTGLIAIILVWI